VCKNIRGPALFEAAAPAYARGMRAGGGQAEGRQASGMQTDGAQTDAAQREAVESELLARAAAWADAIVANDAARIAEFVTDDWVLVSASGISPGNHFLFLVGSGQLSHSAMAAVGDTRVRVWGDTAVLTARVLNTATYGGRRYDADEWTTDVFVRRNDRWRCAVSHYSSREPPPDDQSAPPDGTPPDGTLPVGTPP
jgi:ketosteroid isomerase-like protein